MGWPCPIAAHARRLCWCALALLTAPACQPTRIPCDAGDHAAHVDLSAELAACLRRIDLCTTVACVDATEVECEKYGDKRCAEVPK